MKLLTQQSAKLQTLAIVALFTTFCAAASAADFNPQPDPPGKSKTLTTAHHIPPDDKVLHNPPGDRVVHNPPSDKSADTRVLLPAVKLEKAK
jgi:hypothetical protein